MELTVVDKVTVVAVNVKSSCSCCRMVVLSVSIIVIGVEMTETVSSHSRSLLTEVIRFSSSLIHAQGADLHSYTHQLKAPQSISNE